MALCSLVLLEDPSDAAVLASWLDFVSTLIWQLLVVGFVLLFRAQFVELLGRLSRVKIGGFEGELTQQAVPDPVEAGPEGRSDTGPGASRGAEDGSASGELDVLSVVGPGGFLTETGLDLVIERSGLLASDEAIVDRLLLFRTRTQRTWLVSTTRSIFCVLDDEGTRAKGREVQWRQPIAAVRDVRAGPKAGSVNAGLVDIGERRRWLYSVKLHPDSDELEARIEQLGPK